MAGAPPPKRARTEPYPYQRLADLRSNSHAYLFGLVVRDRRPYAAQEPHPQQQGQQGQQGQQQEQCRAVLTLADESCPQGVPVSLDCTYGAPLPAESIAGTVLRLHRAKVQRLIKTTIRATAHRDGCTWTIFERTSAPLSSSASPRELVRARLASSPNPTLDDCDHLRALELLRWYASPGGAALRASTQEPVTPLGSLEPDTSADVLAMVVSVYTFQTRRGLHLELYVWDSTGDCAADAGLAEALRERQCVCESSPSSVLPPAVGGVTLGRVVRLVVWRQEMFAACVPGRWLVVYNTLCKRPRSQREGDVELTSTDDSVVLCLDPVATPTIAALLASHEQRARAHAQQQRRPNGSPLANARGAAETSPRVQQQQQQVAAETRPTRSMSLPPVGAQQRPSASDTPDFHVARSTASARAANEFFVTRSSLQASLPLRTLDAIAGVGAGNFRARARVVGHSPQEASAMAVKCCYACVTSWAWPEAPGPACPTCAAPLAPALSLKLRLVDDTGVLDVIAHGKDAEMLFNAKGALRMGMASAELEGVVARVAGLVEAFERPNAVFECAVRAYTSREAGDRTRYRVFCTVPCSPPSTLPH
eukprot:m51a1_g14438 hypothetical protein (594) ;mRNA; r:550958-553841